MWKKEGSTKNIELNKLKKERMNERKKDRKRERRKQMKLKREIMWKKEDNTQILNRRSQKERMIESKT